MSYVRSHQAEDIPPETITLIAGLLKLQIPSEDLEGLAVAVRNQYASIDLIDSLDLTDVQPDFSFDPRWEGDDDDAAS